MSLSASVIIGGITQVLIRGPQIIEALTSGKMTPEEAEAAWDEVVAPGWKSAKEKWEAAGPNA